MHENPLVIFECRLLYQFNATQVVHMFSLNIVWAFRGTRSGFYHRSNLHFYWLVELLPFGCVTKLPFPLWRCWNYYFNSSIYAWRYSIDWVECVRVCECVKRHIRTFIIQIFSLGNNKVDILSIATCECMPLRPYCFLFILYFRNGFHLSLESATIRSDTRRYKALRVACWYNTTCRLQWMKWTFKYRMLPLHLTKYPPNDGITLTGRHRIPWINMNWYLTRIFISPSDRHCWFVSF